jgi:hypothetical protein
MATAIKLRNQAWLPQAVFFLALLVGGAGVLALKALGAAPWLVIIWPVVVLAGYASLVWWPAFRLRPDQTGDNVYYLGFLFTLISLAWTLYQFNLAAGVEEVVQNFGVAISSTVAGVAGRVILNQMRTDPYDTERATRLALVDSSRHLRDELDASAIEFTHYRRQTQQAVSDGLRELQDVAAQQLLSTSQGLEQTVAATTSQITAVVTGWSERAQSFNDQSAALVQSMGDLSRRLEAVRAPSSIIEEKFLPAGEAFVALTDSARYAVAGLNGSVDTLAEAASSTRSILVDAGALLEVAKTQSANLGETSAIIEAARAQIAETSVGGANYQDAIARSTQALTIALDGFLQRLDGSLTRMETIAGRQREHQAESYANFEATLGKLAPDPQRRPARTGFFGSNS